MKKNILNWVVYTLCVVVATSFDFLFFYLFSDLIGVFFANIIAYILGTIISISLVRNVCLGKKRFSYFKDILLSLCINILTPVLGTFFIFIGIKLSIDIMLIKVISLGITFILNYIIRFTFLQKM